MSVSNKTKTKLFGKSALRCAICREVLVVDMENSDKFSITGEICHIIAQEPNGPRGDASVSEKYLDSYDNLIILCRTHHKVIDDNPTEYPIEPLKQIKTEHENWVENELKILAPWNNNLSQLTYINIPRLSILAALQGLSLDFPKLEERKRLVEYEYSLYSILIPFTKLLNNLHPLVKELPDLSKPDDRMVGITLSFNDRFWTKNLPDPENIKNFDDFQSGKLAHDPHIYKKFGDWKLVLIINPKWITTYTGYGEFSSGQSRFAGLCTIKSVRAEEKIIYATPLVIGFPKSDFEF